MGLVWRRVFGGAGVRMAERPGSATARFGLSVDRPDAPPASAASPAGMRSDRASAAPALLLPPSPPPSSLQPTGLLTITTITTTTTTTTTTHDGWLCGGGVHGRSSGGARRLASDSAPLPSPPGNRRGRWGGGGRGRERKERERGCGSLGIASHARRVTTPQHNRGRDGKHTGGLGEGGCVWDTRRGHGLTLTATPRFAARFCRHPHRPQPRHRLCMFWEIIRAGAACTGSCARGRGGGQDRRGVGVASLPQSRRRAASPGFPRAALERAPLFPHTHRSVSMEEATRPSFKRECPHSHCGR